MKSIRSLSGMPVICGGKRAGRVVQARLSDDLTRMEGIWVDAGLRGTRFIPAENICRLGDVAVSTDSPGRRCRRSQEPLLIRALSTEGERVGAVSGAEVDETTFRVEALELTRGLWDDLRRGRSRVRSYTVHPAQEAVIIQSGTASGEGKEELEHERPHPEGTFDRGADRRVGGHAVRRHELADRTPLERAGEEDRPLDG